ncbi:hypothetical protein SUNI508_10764 [Seiridium unicorne]|uniref:Uncharacterized protein n=1 Tax=Seiridium unicorne TaxID=138068 RepID=A0ABR2UKE4_9PEZI
MDSHKPSTIMTDTTPSHRKQHKPSGSLGSLYEVLADLDETQLHYLIQEMNHTGHQNVPVSQAVSAFESQNPTDSLNTVRASMLPPAHGVQRQLSKSQRGKLRLHTAFQRAPSLRQRQRPEIQGAAQTVQAVAPETPRRQPTHEQVDATQASDRSPSPAPAIHHESPEPLTRPKRQDKLANAGTSQLADGRRKSPAYRLIPRPDFSLPAGVTVMDLLQLLETEYLSSDSQDPASPTSLSSPSSAHLSPSSPHFSPSPLLLSPTSPIPLSMTPDSNGPRSLRRHTSRLDMALDAERSASGAEEIGLGMLEPRPSRTVSLGAPAGSASIGAIESFDRGSKVETPPPAPPVLEGIFDVLENQ